MDTDLFIFMLRWSSVTILAYGLYLLGRQHERGRPVKYIKWTPVEEADDPIIVETRCCVCGEKPARFVDEQEEDAYCDTHSLIPKMRRMV